MLLIETLMQQIKPKIMDKYEIEDGDETLVRA